MYMLFALLLLLGNGIDALRRVTTLLSSLLWYFFIHICLGCTWLWPQSICAHSKHTSNAIVVVAVVFRVALVFFFLHLSRSVSFDSLTFAFVINVLIEFIFGLAIRNWKFTFFFLFFSTLFVHSLVMFVVITIESFLFIWRFFLLLLLLRRRRRRRLIFVQYHHDLLFIYFHHHFSWIFFCYSSWSSSEFIKCDINSTSFHSFFFSFGCCNWCCWRCA